ncbi:DUF2157 domain-containing protein [Candidatus Viadribacter manganicus]|uniref:DUF2157 domain-containing protein n=1 Tax=Candidatus Viadribacter manganicus TaxID=1759059 RepID=A0A1B1ALR5_9PROT|nr:DUF2157 domain-containing protein [Candidatus Viadribacter manganicus]ANP47509.1 hypothetical protein ATE48_17130 [Candidatus Viadribacter manganicus]
MTSYKDRVKQDLDRWIAEGFVSADKRNDILAAIPDSRRMDAATALAWVGGILLGIAIIAFVAANWDVTPKLVRFAILLVAFLGLASGAAWATHNGRPTLSNMLLTIASLDFAASIGLTGQIFDIAGDPRSAAYSAGVAAFALAAAGRSTGAALAGLIFIALGDFTDRSWFSGSDSETPLMLAAAPLSAYLALRWGSAALAHAAAAAIIYCFGWFAAKTEAEAGVFLFISIGMGAMALGARWFHGQDRPFAGIFYGWFTLGALLFFAIAGYLPWFGDQSGNGGIAHRIVWLAGSGGVLALGRADRQALVTTIGVLSFIIAICALLSDLGLDLLAAAGIFLICSVAALVAGLMLRNRKSAP